MFSEPIEQLFSLTNLEFSRDGISSKAKGLDKKDIAYYVSNSSALKVLRDELLQGIYTPQPISKIEIAKNEVLNHIVTVAEGYQSEDDSLAYSNELISSRGSSSSILEKAKEALRSEVKLLF